MTRGAPEWSARRGVHVGRPRRVDVDSLLRGGRSRYLGTYHGMPRPAMGFERASASFSGRACTEPQWAGPAPTCGGRTVPVWASGSACRTTRADSDHSVAQRQ